MLPGSPDPARNAAEAFPEGLTVPQGRRFPEWADGASPGGIRVRPGAGAQEVSTSSVMLLPHAPASVVTARWQISAHLREAGVVRPAIGDAAVVVSELLTNAIMHARPLPGARVLVAWALREGSLELAVSDGGSMTLPRAAQPSLSSIGGRGLAIVEQLSCRWGALASDFGLTVWAVLPVPGDGRAPGPARGAHSGGAAAAGRHRA
jgi:anti-sigma regulatory factor (Ser/Thr protein kinase)